MYNVTEYINLEDTMIMYGVYNSDTLIDLIDTVHRMQNFTTWNEKTFAGKLRDWMEIYAQDKGVHNYAINSVLFLTMIREKYVKMYERFIEETKIVFKSNKSFIKRVSTHFSIASIKTGENPKRSKNSNCKI